MKCSTQSQYIREHILVSIYISDIIQSIQPDLTAILQSPILQSSTHTTPGFCCATLIESTSNVSSQSSQRSHTRHTNAVSTLYSPDVLSRQAATVPNVKSYQFEFRINSTFKQVAREVFTSTQHGLQLDSRQLIFNLQCSIEREH